MGHKGHMMLASSVIHKAEQVGGDPYFVVSRTVGKDDPLTPEEKIYIYKKVFPKEAGIFHTGPNLNSILTNLSGQYKNVVLVLGEDQVQEFQWLMRPNKQGELNYKSYGLSSLQIIARQEGCTISEASRFAEGFTGNSSSTLRGKYLSGRSLPKKQRHYSGGSSLGSIRRSYGA